MHPTPSKNYKPGAGERAWLGALATAAEDSSSVPSTHAGHLTSSCDASSREFNVLFWLHRHAHICAGTHIKFPKVLRKLPIR